MRSSTRKHVPSSPSEETLNRRLVRLDSRVRNQFDLVTSRTGWLLTSHAFLLAAFATMVGSLPTKPTASALDLLRVALLFLLPVVGFVSGVLVLQSVEAAYRVVADLKKARSELLVVMGRRFGYENTEPKPEQTRAGDFPPKVFPYLLCAIWVVLFLFGLVLAVPVLASAVGQ